MPQQPPDPRFTEDSRFTPDDSPIQDVKPSAPSNKDIFWNSIKKGAIEGLPELRMAEPWDYPGATDPAPFNMPIGKPGSGQVARMGTVGDVSRSTMPAVGAGLEIYNKIIRPVLSPENIAQAGIATMFPAMIPYIGGVYGAKMASQIPEQARGVYQSAQEKGWTDPETIGKGGELGLNTLMTAGMVRGSQTHLKNTVNPQPKSLTHVGVSNKFDELPLYPPVNPDITGTGTSGLGKPPSGPAETPGVPIRPPVAPSVERPIRAAKQPNIEEFEDVAGPNINIPVQKPLAYLIKREDVSPELIADAHKQGYIFENLNDRGDFRFVRKGAGTKPVETGESIPIESTGAGDNLVEPDIRIIDGKEQASESFYNRIASISEAEAAQLPELLFKKWAYFHDSEGISSEKLSSQAMVNRAIELRKNINNPKPADEYPGTKSELSPPETDVTEIVALIKNGRTKNVAELQRELGISYARTRVLWREAKRLIEETKMDDGFYDRIAPVVDVPDRMSPTPTGESFVVRKGEASKETVKAARAMGYEFDRITDKGDFVFKKSATTPTEIPPTEITPTEIVPTNEPPVIPTKGKTKPVKETLDPATLTNPEARSLYARVADLDARGADALAYKEIVPPTATGRLLRGETWRSRIINHIKEKESFIKSSNESGLFEPEGTSRRWGMNLDDLPQSDKPGFFDRLKDDKGVMNIEADKRFTPDDRIQTDNLSDEPQFARTKEGGIKVGADVRQLGKVLGSSLYSGDISTIATKELLQNSLDAIGTAGASLGPNGRIEVTFKRGDRTLRVQDNGKGLTRPEIETVFTDLGSSGKRDIADAVGGFGLAKAAPLLGGEHVKVVTTTYNKKSRNIVEISFEGTPDELLSGVKLTERVMPPRTETGTSVTVKVPKPEFYDAEQYLRQVAEHSDYEGNIHLYNEYGHKQIPKSGVGEHITDIDTPQALVNLHIPENTTRGSNQSIRLILKNNGMYQSHTDMWFDRAIPDIPYRVSVNIHSKVKEGHIDYPFTANREQLRGNVEREVKKYIEDNIIAPSRKRYSNDLQKMYDDMPSTVTERGTTVFFHDTGTRFTPNELQLMKDSPAMKRLADQIHAITREGVSYDFSWRSRLERVGIIFDDKLRGIHVPNPGKSTSAILVNPLGLMSTRNPNQAAMGFIHTTLHEVAHVEPSSYGHGDDYNVRLGDINERFGADRYIEELQRFRNIISDSSGSYTPEIQKLLLIYQESRGRGVIADDLLTRTGSKSRPTSGGKEVPVSNPESAGKGTLGGFKPGTTIVIKSEQATVPNIKKLHEAGFRFAGESDNGGMRFTKSAEPAGGPILEEEVGSTRPTKRGIQGQLGAVQDAQKSSAIMEAFNFPRGVMASTDLSAPLRQGLPLIHKKAFWTAIKPMMESWHTEAGFQASQANIANRPLFKKRVGIDGEALPSFADDAGLKLTDLTDLSSREEAIMSTWAESGGMFDRNKWMAEHGGTQLAGAYRATAGKMVRKSNRAYTAFLNNLRADTFEALIKDGKIFSDIATNLPQARLLADFVNTASGRGSIGMFEKSADILNTGFFAPRLIASRIKMINILNPNHFIYANPQLRKEALKSFLAMGVFGNTVLQLAKMGGATVETDPASADFAKAKIGNVRIDPWGGFQQYFVAANRILRPSFARVPGLEKGTDSGLVPLDLTAGTLGSGGWRTKSSRTGKEFDLNNPQGPYGQTILDVGKGLLRGKVNPVIGFGWSVFDDFTEMTGRKMNFTTPNPMENAIGQRFVPIFLQSVYELAREDPSLLPLAIPAAFGMGTQAYDPYKR